MVKLLTSSKLPGGPKGSTEPLGPRPGTFCHSIGARSAVSEEEQRARSKGARRTRAKRTHFILVLLRGGSDCSRETHRARDCFSTRCPATPAGDVVTLTLALYS